MMLNGYGAVKRSVARGRANHEEAAEAAPPRRSNGRAMAIGAPLGASFLGLLLMRGKDVAAGEAADAAPGGAVAGEQDLQLSPDRATDPAASQGLSVVPAAGAAAMVAGATAAGASALVDRQPAAPGDATPLRAESTSESAAALPGAAAAPESTPPPTPEIGDVVLAFGSEAPFAFPDASGDVAGFPDENIGDLGDPRDIVSEPVPPPEIPASGADAGAGGGGAGGGGAGAGGGGDVVDPAPGNPGLRITGTPQNDYLVGTAGDDIIDGVGGKNTIVAGAGDDLVYGGPGNDVLRGGAGNDSIYGGGGNNEIYGDDGDNQLFGGTGNDSIHGGPGSDRLDGVAGINKLYAGTGNSTLVVNDWRDVAVGNNEGPNGGGVDTLEVAPGFAASLRGKFSSLSADGSTTFVMGTSPAGRQFPDDANDFKWQVDPRIDQVRLTGDDRHDVVASDQGNTIWGNDGDNRLYGGAGDDVLYAGGGNDTLHGSTGSDYLDGGDGDDLLYGGAGDTELHGGGGDDLYAFGLAEGGKNTIFDHQGVNRLRFDGLEDPAGLEARLAGDDLVIGHGGADIVRIDDYANHREAFAGVEHQGEVLSLDRFIDQPSAAAAGSGGADDLLAIYLGPQSVEADDDILDPAWLDDDGPAHDAPFALYESATEGFSPAPTEVDGSRSAPDAAADDMLGGFLRVEPLWTGPEDGLYAPETAAYQGNGEEAEQARG